MTNPSPLPCPRVAAEGEVIRASSFELLSSFVIRHSSLAANGYTATMQTQPTRRHVLAAAAGALIAGPMSNLLRAEDAKSPFKIGACDWSLGKRQQFEALDLARKIGLDGVQVSFDDSGKP